MGQGHVICEGIGGSRKRDRLWKDEPLQDSRDKRRQAKRQNKIISLEVGSTVASATFCYYIAYICLHGAKERRRGNRSLMMICVISPGKLPRRKLGKQGKLSFGRSHC